MVPSGPSTPIGGTQSVTPSLLRSNSGLLGGQGGSVHSQPTFPSRSQYNNVNLLGSVPNVSSFLNHSYGNGVLQSGFSGAATGQRGGIDTSSEQDPLSAGGGGMGFKPSPSFSAPSMVNATPSVPAHGQQLSNTSSSLMMTDQQQVPQMDPQNLQHSQQPAQQFSAPSNNQPPQSQYQSIQDGLGGIPPVKLESQVKMESPVTNDQHRPQQQQQQPHPNNHQHPHQNLQSVRGPGVVKLEPPSVQSMRSLPPVKLEAQHSEHSMYLHQQQQQQQQQLLQMSMSRQSSHAAAVAQINLLQQQRSLQMQQQQHQQQLLKAYPQQRPQLQQQFAAQNLPIRPPLKPAYEVGMCARRLTQYMDQQQNRPPDNSIEYWRNFVSEYFAPNAKKKWCVSMYGSGRQANGVFPQDVWHCDICNRKPGRGFEATVEVLPRLFKIKYESGTLEELLYVDMPREHHNPSGQIVLDYAKAIQESVFEQLRVVRDGQLRIVFSSDLKICSWEFCAKRHEELIPRRLLIPQVSQLGTAAQKYQTAAQSSSTNMSALDLQNNCNMFVASARQIAKALEVPLVNDLGYTKRYVRCLQISEVVNSMKDLIDYSRVTGQGPMESLAKFPRRTVQGSQNQHSAVDHHHQQQQQQQLQFSHQQQGRAPQQQQPVPQSPSNGPTNPSSQGIPAAKLAAPSNGMSCSVNIPPHNNTSSSSTPPTSSIAGLIHQNSSNNSRPPLNPLNNMGGGFYGSNSMPSPGGASVTLHQPAQLQSNPSPFQSPAPSSSNNNPNTTSQSQHQHQNNALATSASTHVATTSHVNSINSPAHSLQSQPSHSNNDGGDLNDTQSSVQKIIQEMMISNSQLNSQGGVMGSMGSMVNEMKNNANGMILPSNNGSLSMNGANNAGGGGMVGTGYGGISQAGMHNGNRGAAMMGNNPMAAMNGRSAGMGMVGMSSTMLPREQGGMTQQQDLGSQFLSGLGAMNGFNNLQFDWKPSP